MFTTSSLCYVYRTGAVRVGDRILAINGTSLRGQGLFDALQFLYGAGDSVSLKIMRPLKSPGEGGDVDFHHCRISRLHTVVS